MIASDQLEIYFTDLTEPEKLIRITFFSNATKKSLLETFLFFHM